MFTKLSLLAMVTAVICEEPYLNIITLMLIGIAGANGLRLPALLAARQTTCSSTHTVVSGDTCDSIAVKNNVTAAALEAANPVSFEFSFVCGNLLINGFVVVNIGYRCTVRQPLRWRIALYSRCCQCQFHLSTRIHCPVR